MKKLIGIVLATAGFALVGAEYYTVPAFSVPTAIARDAKVVGLDVLSTEASSVVTVSVIRAVSSYTNCVKVAVVTNGIGEVSTVTNRWMGLKEAKVYTNALGSATCSGGVGHADINKFIFGGDKFVAAGVNKSGETVKAKLIIEK